MRETVITKAKVFTAFVNEANLLSYIKNHSLSGPNQAIVAFDGLLETQIIANLESIKGTVVHVEKLEDTCKNICPSSMTNCGVKGEYHAGSVKFMVVYQTEE